MGATTWEQLGVRHEIVEALNAQGIPSPNKLQSQAMPVLAGGGDLVLGAQTGSGKTLTYLLPILQRLKDEEDVAGDTFVQRPSRPRALVLVPTRELGDQVKGVAKSICHYLKLRSAGISGGVPLGKQAKLLAAPLDLLVATPGRLLAHSDNGALTFSGISAIVIDEVDTIFEAGFGDEVRKLLALVATHRQGKPVQHVAVGATHPQSAKDLYARAFPAARELMVDVHTVPQSLTQRFVQVGGQPTDKCEALIDALGPPSESGDLSGVRTLIFCNSKDSARFVDHYLTERRYTTSNYHGGILPEARSLNFKNFKEGRTEILVCSDLAARGLDGLDVSHVVQFDFARSVVDYLHRAGRTARAGQRGRVTSLVTKWDTALAKEVQLAGGARVSSQPLSFGKVASEARQAASAAEASSGARAAGAGAGAGSATARRFVSRGAATPAGASPQQPQRTGQSRTGAAPAPRGPDARPSRAPAARGSPPAARGAEVPRRGSRGASRFPKAEGSEGSGPARAARAGTGARPAPAAGARSAPPAAGARSAPAGGARSAPAGARQGERAPPTAGDRRRR